jgi:hypothetical protein
VYEANPALVDERLAEGTRKMRQEAIATMEVVRQAMNMYHPKI